ncbi:universal stress protein [Nocardiopsis terrae]|uniref:Nucleotide-binding universal stress UspA family protein n=1 Tax=Nocardiopsis terrae TaxID=372655 RepID=A0ABR9HDJ7_9ACTN|nr:universal stress protein [Nocardiopsis terrae]MBE1456870.1 nucleotide-binding universal stress UspA family protein [Nocardiopsis terrae]GHC74693.1 universal stress protein [Nocardiopsis terrae]
MDQKSTAPVVVAVNGSPESGRALDWAAEDARRRGLRLRVVYAFDWPNYHSVPRGLPGFDVHEFARRVVDEARERALEQVPGLSVEAVHVTADPEPVLLSESQKAHTLVLGAHRMTAMDAVLPDSTALELLVSASCPVVVVPDREPGPATGRVIVGADGSATARTAAEWAFSEAELRGAALRAVTVRREAPWWRFGALEEPTWTRPDDDGETEESAAEGSARQALAESVADARARHPQVRVEEVVRVGHPVEVLCAEARDCDLMVVGSHGRGGFAGMLLGSVSRNVISHSPCPVVVVRAPRS